MRNSFRQGGCSFRTDPRDGEPVLGTGIDDVPDRFEPFEERSCADRRDAGHGGEHRLVRVVPRRALRIVRCGTPTATTPCAEDLEPGRRVLRTRASNDVDAELADGEQRAADGGGLQRPRVQVVALDEEIWRRVRLTKPSDLWPEPTPDDREVQVAHALPLDQRMPNGVVAGPQPANFDLQAQLVQRSTKATLPLVDVHDDAQPHRKSLRFETERH